MKKFILGLGLLTFPFAAFAASPVGNWQTVDENGQKKAVVRITQDPNGNLRGVITKLIQKPGALCEKCPGDKKGKPIEGMSIIWSLKPEGSNTWSEGAILDPQSGSTYNLKAELKDGGKRFELRGFRGVSLLGRTQVWTRID